MTVYIALLRAVNVGGTGKLPMSELKTMCQSIGFTSVRTYIASGNVIFESDLPEKSVAEALGDCLETYAGKPVGVLVRTAAELKAVLEANPFKSTAPNQTVAIFLDGPPSPGVLDTVSGRQGEEIALGSREIYISYGAGMGTSKLKIPAAKTGTARNMNTIAKLAEMAAA